MDAIFRASGLKKKKRKAGDGEFNVEIHFNYPFL